MNFCGRAERRVMCWNDCWISIWTLQSYIIKWNENATQYIIQPLRPLVTMGFSGFHFVENKCLFQEKLAPAEECERGTVNLNTPFMQIQSDGRQEEKERERRGDNPQEATRLCDEAKQKAALKNVVCMSQVRNAVSWMRHVRHVTAAAISVCHLRFILNCVNKNRNIKRLTHEWGTRDKGTRSLYEPFM